MIATRRRHLCSCVHRVSSGVRGGFSLLELLLVMIIVGLVMGAGLGLVTSIDFSSTQTAGAVRGAVEPWITARPDDTVARGSGDRSEVDSSWVLGSADQGDDSR